MILSEGARALRKQQHTDRLAAKAQAADDGDWEAYSAYFAGQGLEVAKAEHNAKITRARQLIRETRDILDEARVTGNNIPGAIAGVATAKATLVALNAQKQQMFGRPSAFAIGGGNV